MNTSELFICVSVGLQTNSCDRNLQTNSINILGGGDGGGLLLGHGTNKRTFIGAVTPPTDGMITPDAFFCSFVPVYFREGTTCRPLFGFSPGFFLFFPPNRRFRLAGESIPPNACRRRTPSALPSPIPPGWGPRRSGSQRIPHRPPGRRIFRKIYAHFNSRMIMYNTKIYC